MNKTLTTAAVRALKPADDRREVPDAGCGGLYLVIEPTGKKSWAMRARRPDKRPGKLRPRLGRRRRGARSKSCHRRAPDPAVRPKTRWQPSERVGGGQGRVRGAQGGAPPRGGEVRRGVIRHVPGHGEKLRREAPARPQGHPHVVEGGAGAGARLQSNGK